MSDYSAFAEAERAGWADARRAGDYVDLFSSVSDQVIVPLLDAAGAEPGLDVLDLCCGQGNVTQALAARGCRVTGIDFSPAMVERAQRRVPVGTILQADAQNLPFADATFDVVVSNLGICHVPDQPRALREVRRVLRPDGRFGMTVWGGPDLSPGYELVYRVIQQHGAPGIVAPAGPDFHQFANRAIAQELIEAAGFTSFQHAILSCGWDLDSPEGLAAIFERGTVRTALLLSRQPKQNLEAIRAALAAEVRSRFANGDRWRVPIASALVSAAA